MARLSCAGVLVWLLMVLAVTPDGAFAQGAMRIETAAPENLMKVCGDQWRAIKETDAARRTTWPQYLARCRAEAAQTRTHADVAPAKPPVPVPAPGGGVPSAQPQLFAQGAAQNPAQGAAQPSAQGSQKPPAQAVKQATAAAAPEAGGGSSAPSGEKTPELVFPSQVSARFASERPQQARQKTCSEQFQANKAVNANGGLRWVEKGGGYWSKCNAHLKQARA